MDRLDKKWMMKTLYWNKQDGDDEDDEDDDADINNDDDDIG